MFRRIRPTLAILVACVGVPFVAVGASPATGDITVYRCQAGTQVTLQDEPEYAPPAYPTTFPPPPMFQCTDYDGEIRYAEDYAPNTRCVPLPVLGYRVIPGSPAAASCRWVQESCLQLDDASACDQFRAKLKAARSEALHASGSQAPYRKSEAERLARIVDESCS